jgi:hypothetical protein
VDADEDARAFGLVAGKEEEKGLGKSRGEKGEHALGQSRRAEVPEDEGEWAETKARRSQTNTSGRRRS